MEWLVGSLGFPVFLLVLALVIFWDRRRRRSSSDAVADGPADEPYKVFTREYDLELDAEHVPAALRDACLDFYNGWSDFRGLSWKQAVADAENFIPPDCSAILEALAAQLKQAPVLPDRLAVTMLVDQSGSMRGEPIVAVSTAVKVVAEVLGSLGVRTEILGYSTAGWHGGHAKRRWLERGSPPRPGRLCALLHIIYKSGDVAEWSEASQRVILHPDALRENIDGEALDWAWARLKLAPGDRKLLVILSDGASVDDVTLQYNGPSYLERDLLARIAQIERDPDVTLGAIGIGHHVQRYYRLSRESTLDTITERLADLLAEMAGRA